ncbi:MAG: lipoprotein LpqH [Mycobacteriaceae bacterium]|nr:lipoprotein LpqH [Mycobacteriaceae bacterium]
MVSAAVVAVAGLAACSSGSQPNHPSQASVTINGNTVASKQSVSCNQQINALPGAQQQWYWTIAVGDRDVPGVRAMLDGSGDKLTTESVHILNLGGFTGAYTKNDGGQASASFGSETFTITGTANGFNTDKPDQPATATFKIVATC